MKRAWQTDKRDGWYEIDVNTATKLLEGRPQNRPLKKVLLRRYTKEMESGNWYPTGEPIILTNKGRLLDGQHRLRAVQLSGKPIVTYVIHVDSSFVKAFDYMNRGGQRSTADRLAIEGVAEYTTTAALISQNIKFENGSFDKFDVPSPREVRLYYQRNTEAVDAATQFACSNRKKYTGLVQVSLMAFTYFQTHVADPDHADTFCTLLATGEGIPKNSVISVLRRRLIENAAAKAKLNRREVTALIIKAWNHYRRGKTTRQLRWQAERERYPRFEGA